MVMIAVLGIGLWGCGIPVCSLYLLWKNRNRLDDIDVRKKYGFLYKGYNDDSYFWEIVVTARKISMVLFSTVFAVFGKSFQAIVVFIFMLIFLILTDKMSPFLSRKLNRLESIAIFAQLMSIWIG
jgi:hypothetical protein